MLTTCILTAASHHSERPRTSLRLYLALAFPERVSRFDTLIRNWFPGIDWG